MAVAGGADGVTWSWDVTAQGTDGSTLIGTSPASRYRFLLGLPARKRRADRTRAVDSIGRHYMSGKRGKLSLPDAAPASYCHAEQGYLLAHSLPQGRAYLARLIGDPALVRTAL